MEKVIPVPKLLTDGIARALNNKMLANNRSFVFLSEQDTMIYRTPSSFVEAFDMYVTRLYVLYHDCGMYFLNCYLNEDPKNGKKCRSHIRFVNNCRTALVHSDNPFNGKNIYCGLKNFYFKGDASFQYKNWLDFWHNATEAHWEKLVKKIVKGSDMVMELLENVASHIPNYKIIYESVSEIFLNNRVYSYTNKSGANKDVDIYAKSFDSRFLKLICSHLRYLVWEDEDIAKRELNAIEKLKPDKQLSDLNMFEPSRIVQELINMLISSLKNRDFNDSELLYLSISQNLKQLIDVEIRKAHASDDEDYLS